MADIVYSNYFVKLDAWLLVSSLKPAFYDSVPGTLRRLRRSILVSVITSLVNPTIQSQIYSSENNLKQLADVYLHLHVLQSYTFLRRVKRIRARPVAITLDHGVPLQPSWWKTLPDYKRGNGCSLRWLYRCSKMAWRLLSSGPASWSTASLAAALSSVYRSRVYIATKQIRLIPGAKFQSIQPHSQTISSQLRTFSLGYGDETMPGLISRLHVAYGIVHGFTRRR